MDSIWGLIAAPFREIFFLKAMIGGVIVAVVSGVAGSLVVLRRMSFLGDALSHAMIAGVAAGYLVMKMFFGIEAHAPGMLVGSLIAAIMTVALIGFVSGISRIKEDTAIGAMYTGVFAAGVVAVSVFRDHIHIDLMHFIMGDVLSISDADLVVAIVACTIVLSVIILFFRYFQITSFDPVMAASIGIPVVVIEYVFTACISFVVVSAVSMVGVILASGLLVTPAASAYLLTDRLERMMIISAILGASSVVGGLYLCIWLDSSGGGAIMLFATLQFLVILFLAPKHGIISRWLRLRRMIPQQLKEDILGALIRKSPMAVSDIATELKNPPRLRRAVRYLMKNGFVEDGAAGLRLNAKGTREAEQVLRSHRLWESYLSHLGSPAEQIHKKADLLEHVNDPEAVSYIDDLLCHPEKDPHGRDIPVCLPETEAFPLSSLRHGMKCTIESVPEFFTGLVKGETAMLVSRDNGGRIWVVSKTDGSDIRIEHSLADSILVRLA